MMACSGSPTTPTPAASALPAPAQVTPVIQHVIPNGVGDTWTVSGVKVTITADEWGPGSCHTSGGIRTFEIVNGSKERIYSRRTSYGGTSPGCGATQEIQSGKPTFLGPEEILPDGKLLGHDPDLLPGSGGRLMGA